MEHELNLTNRIFMKKAMHLMEQNRYKLVKILDKRYLTRIKEKCLIKTILFITVTLYQTLKAAKKLLIKKI